MPLSTHSGTRGKAAEPHSREFRTPPVGRGFRMPVNGCCSHLRAAVSARPGSARVGPPADAPGVRVDFIETNAADTRRPNVSRTPRTVSAGSHFTPFTRLGSTDLVPLAGPVCIFRSAHAGEVISAARRLDGRYSPPEPVG